MLFYPQRNPDDAENAIFLTAVEVEQDETTRCSLRSAAVCRQNRPDEQRLLAAALDAPAGYGGYYGVSGAEVAAGKRPSAYRAGRGPADTDRLLSGVGSRPGKTVRRFPGANDGAFAGAQTVPGKIYNAQLPGTEPQIFTSRAGERGHFAVAEMPRRACIGSRRTPRQATNREECA